MKITLIVHPNSKKPRLEKDLYGITHIYVGEPPLEGKANKEVMRVLSELYGVPRSKITLVTGATARHKIFDIDTI